MKTFTRRLAAVLAAAVLAPTALSAQPAIAFDGPSLLVTGATPGGEVALLTVWREQFYGWARVSRFAEVIPALPDGSAAYEAPREIPAESLWIVTDLATGTSAMATPRPEPYREMALGERGIAFEPTHLGVEGETLDLLVVRPGLGAWSLTLWDAGEGDADATADGRLAAALGDLAPLGATPLHPGDRQAGDVLVGIDARRMEYFVLRFAPAPGS